MTWLEIGCVGLYAFFFVRYAAIGEQTEPTLVRYPMNTIYAVPGLALEWWLMYDVFHLPFWLGSLIHVIVGMAIASLSILVVGEITTLIVDSAPAVISLPLSERYLHLLIPFPPIIRQSAIIWGWRYPRIGCALANIPGSAQRESFRKSGLTLSMDIDVLCFRRYTSERRRAAPATRNHYPPRDEFQASISLAFRNPCTRSFRGFILIG